MTKKRKLSIYAIINEQIINFFATKDDFVDKKEISALSHMFLVPKAILNPDLDSGDQIIYLN